MLYYVSAIFRYRGRPVELKGGSAFQAKKAPQAVAGGETGAGAALVRDSRDVPGGVRFLGRIFQ